MTDDGAWPGPEEPWPDLLDIMEQLVVDSLAVGEHGDIWVQKLTTRLVTRNMIGQIQHGIFS